MSSSGSVRGLGKGKDLPGFLRQLMEESSVLAACDRRKTDLPVSGRDSQARGYSGSPRWGGEMEIA